MSKHCRESHISHTLGPVIETGSCPLIFQCPHSSAAWSCLAWWCGLLWLQGSALGRCTPLPGRAAGSHTGSCACLWFICLQVLDNSLEAHVMRSDNSSLAKDCRKDIKAANARLMKLGRKVNQLCLLSS